jgi:hypothetical protein
MITNTVEHARQAARGTLLELSAHLGKIANSAREAEGRGIDALLDRLGLQRKQSALRPALWLAAGALAAGMALSLMSPTGKEARRRIVTWIRGETEKNATPVKATEHRAEQAAKSETSPVRNGAKQQTS